MKKFILFLLLVGCTAKPTLDILEMGEYECSLWTPEKIGKINGVRYQYAIFEEE